MSDADSRQTLEYATPDASGHGARARATRRRLLYCVGLPLIAFGLCDGLGPGDRFVTAMVAAAGAVLVGMAIPTE
jgi:hypothetical protein